MRWERTRCCSGSRLRAILFALTQVAIVYGATAGGGGLGLQAATAIAGLQRIGELHAFGPGHVDNPFVDSASVHWHITPRGIVNRVWPRTPYRWAVGALQTRLDRAAGRWASRQLNAIQPGLVYSFTQVGLEALRWAAKAGVASILDNPNGHIRNFRSVYVNESRTACGARYTGHPSAAMVSRVEAEYEAATWIRVSSPWARDSMIRFGVPGDKIRVIEQPVDLIRFAPRRHAVRAPHGPLRLVFVGSLDVRKGFHYLLRAMRRLGPDRVTLHVVGSTGTRSDRALWDRESHGLSTTMQPGDPVPAYHEAELLVLPSLEDGFGFVVAEAMASGLPVIVTEECGAKAWVQAETGWIVPAGDVDALAAAMQRALDSRAELPAMGAAGRIAAETRGSATNLDAFASWARLTLSSSL